MDVLNLLVNLTGLLWAEVARHLWQVTLFFLLALAAAAVLRRAPARFRYRVWQLAAIKLVIPPILLLLLFGGLIRSAGQSGSSVKTAPAAAAIEATVDTLAAPIRVISEPASTIKISVRGWRLLFPVFSVVWLAGFLFLAVRWATRYWTMSDIVKSADRRTSLETEVIERLKDRLVLSRSPQVAMTAEVDTPCLWGVFKPTLLLPEKLANELTESELEALITHELVHLERRDNLVATGMWWLATFFWFYPVAWMIDFLLLREREQACDERVVQLLGSSADYISAICKAALPGPVTAAAGACCATGSNARRRIKMISDKMTSEVNRPVGKSIGSLVVFGLTATLAAFMLASTLASANGSASVPAANHNQAVSQAVSPAPKDLSHQAAYMLTPDPKQAEWLAKQIDLAPEIPVKFENADSAAISITSATVKTLTGDQIERGTGYRPAVRIPDRFIVAISIGVLNNTDSNASGVALMFGDQNGWVYLERTKLKIPPYGTFTLSMGIGIGTSSSIRPETMTVLVASATFDGGKKWVNRFLAKHAPAGGVAGGTAGGVPEGTSGGVAGGVPGGVGSGSGTGSGDGAGNGSSSGTGSSSDGGAGSAVPPKIIRKSSGVLQESALKRVEPDYPADAKAAGISGTVIVEITIDEEGKVTDAHALGGPEQLRQAAVDAAKQWLFRPTTLSGIPVKVVSTITFGFAM